MCSHFENSLAYFARTVRANFDMSCTMSAALRTFQRHDYIIRDWQKRRIGHPHYGTAMALSLDIYRVSIIPIIEFVSYDHSVSTCGLLISKAISSLDAGTPRQTRLYAHWYLEAPVYIDDKGSSCNTLCRFR